MKAAALNRLVAIQKPGGTLDGYAARVTSFTTVAMAYASIEPLAGREAFLAAQRQASSSHKITLRFSTLIARIDASWRIVSGQEFTAAAATDAITTPGPKVYAVDDEVSVMTLSGALPAPLAFGTPYYIKTAPGSGIYTLAATVGGATVDITNTGSGRNVIDPEFYTFDEPPRNLANANRELEIIVTRSIRHE